MMMRQLVYTFFLFLLFSGASGFALKGGISKGKAQYDHLYRFPSWITNLPVYWNDTARVKEFNPLPARKDDLTVDEFAGEIYMSVHTRSAIEEFRRTFYEEYIGLKKKGVPQFNMIEGVFKKYGLPGELKYLAVIESKLKSSATSWAGAVGPWQFMPRTAQLLGLKVTPEIDERRDFSKSTRAAAKYIKELYREFDDWLLVMAAYNCGPGRVKSAMRKSGSTDFWEMQQYLPLETRKHVKKYIGIHYTFEGALGITTFTKAETAEKMTISQIRQAAKKLTDSELQRSRSIWLSGKYYSLAIARTLAMELEEFDKYNPDFDKLMGSSENRYELRLPAEKMDLFIRDKYEILQLSVELLLNTDPLASPGG